RLTRRLRSASSAERAKGCPGFTNYFLNDSGLCFFVGLGAFARNDTCRFLSSRCRFTLRLSTRGWVRPMGTFLVKCKIENVADRTKSTVLNKVLVDTGSEYTWV